MIVMKKLMPVLLLLLLLNTINSEAHVKLLFPTGGETFVGGENITIEWSELANHNGTNWELYYSLDDGSTWITISDSIAYSEREFDWILPVEETTFARIKVIQNNPGTNYDDVSPKFNIAGPADIKQVPSSHQLFESLKIYPNPISSVGKISFSLVKKESISFEFYSISGKMVDKIPVRNFLPGTYTINWNIKSLKSGFYICIVKTDSMAQSYKLNVYN